jgi:hypothetical protein
MTASPLLHSAEVFKSRRFVLSIAGAVFISAIGFGLIFHLVAWLVPRWLMWLWLLDQRNHRILSASIGAIFPALFSIAMVTMTIWASRRQNIQKKLSHPKQTTLPL